MIIKNILKKYINNAIYIEKILVSLINIVINNTKIKGDILISISPLVVLVKVIML